MNDRDPSLPHYLGVDIETTGLDERVDRILEVAAIALDADLNELDVIHYRVQCPYHVLLGMSDRVKEWHTKTGLVDLDAPDNAVPGGMSPTAVEAGLQRALSSWFGDYAPPLLGHSVQFDRRMLAAWMPSVTALLSHRNMDARSVENLAPDYGWPQLDGDEHTALGDVRRSIAVYREARALLRAGIASNSNASLLP